MPTQEILLQFMPLVLIFIVFYFLLIRPQQKKQKEHQHKLSQIRRGDNIMTQAGIFGVVNRVLDDNNLEITIAAGVNVKVARQFIADVVSKTGETTETIVEATTIDESPKKSRKK